eukprot:g3662.t1
MLCSFVSRREKNVLVVTSSKGEPFWQTTHEIINARVYDAGFTCCSRNHVDSKGRKMTCDKLKVKRVLKILLKSKIEMLREEKEFFTANLFVLLGDRWCGVGDELAMKKREMKLVGKYEDGTAIRELKAVLGFDDSFPLHGADEGGMTLLMWAAILREDSAARDLVLSQPNNVDMVELLIKGGAKEDVVDVNGWDILMTAVAYGEVDVVNYILDRFPEWNLERREHTEGCTVLHLALSKGRVDVHIVNTLLRSGTSIETLTWSGASCLMLAAGNVDCSPAKILSIVDSLDSCSRNRLTSADSETYRHANVKKSDEVRVKINQVRRPQSWVYLLKDWYSRYFSRGGNMTFGASALHYAAIRGDTEILQIILASGGDPNSRNSMGMTPKELADFCGPFEYVDEIILKHSICP